MSPRRQAHPEPPTTPITGWRAIVAYALIAAAAASLLLMQGAGGPLSARITSALFILLDSGWAPLLYLLGALGLGRLCRPLVPPLPTRWVLELGIGLTLMLSLTHLLGVIGVLSTFSAWLVTALGLGLLAGDATRFRASISGAIVDLRPSIHGTAALVGAVLVLLMACNPPGALWDSEYGAYDALSYHLQLPREWVDRGAIWPGQHNVYSFLPGYIEAAYAHMAHMTGGNLTDASAAMGAHLLSAFMLIASAMAIGPICHRVITLHAPGLDAASGTALSRMLTLGTPWLILVGSIAYNEIGVVLLGICAIAAAAEREIKPVPRAALTAVIVAGACSCKPTALFLLAPPVGVVLLAGIPPRRWASPVGVGVLVGALTLAPWLLRNEAATGNPVFPQLAGLFGPGHWAPAQHALYADAHTFDGSPIDRLALLIVPDADGSDHVARFRGLTNLQWGVTPWVGLLGLVVLLARRSTRRIGLIAAIAIALPLIAWMLLTHLQSRFLVPLAPAFIVTGVLGVAAIPAAVVREGLARTLGVIAVGWSVLVALSQSGGNPFNLLDLGPGVFSGEIQVANPPWTAVLNQVARPGETVSLLGDATSFYVRQPVMYNTVYDRWIIEDAIEADPSDPSAWTRTLQDRGIGVIVIGFSEIDRFGRSGWLPEPIDPGSLAAWVATLGEPIQVWEDPRTGAAVRAAYRIDER